LQAITSLKGSLHPCSIALGSNPSLGPEILRNLEDYIISKFQSIVSSIFIVEALDDCAEACMIRAFTALPDVRCCRQKASVQQPEELSWGNGPIEKKFLGKF
jgi:hypothetical protein